MGRASGQFTWPARSIAADCFPADGRRLGYDARLASEKSAVKLIRGCAGTEVRECSGLVAHVGGQRGVRSGHPADIQRTERRDA
jgi:hypothetical protein